MTLRQLRPNPWNGPVTPTSGLSAKPADSLVTSPRAHLLLPSAPHHGGPGRRQEPPQVSLPPPSAFRTAPQRPCLRLLLPRQLRTVFQRLSISLRSKRPPEPLRLGLIPPTSSPPLPPPAPLRPLAPLLLFQSNTRPHLRAFALAVPLAWKGFPQKSLPRGP